MTKISVDVLEQAKAVIQRQGWTKHELIACGTGEVCALGALTVALGAEVVVDTRTDGTPLYRFRYPYEAQRPEEAEIARVGNYPYGGTPEEIEAYHQRVNEVWGAYNAAEGEYEDAFEAHHRALVQAIRDVSGGDYRDVPKWNDRDEATVQDILDVFDRAIDNAKETSSV